MEPGVLLGLIRSARSRRAFVERDLLDGVPWVFDGDEDQFAIWRRRASSAGGFSVENVYIVGSAATGYSLSPRKAGREFRKLTPSQSRSSDIDIAVVDAELFTGIWDSIVKSDRGRRMCRHLAMVMPPGFDPIAALDDVRLNIYRGIVGDRQSSVDSDARRRLRMMRSATTGMEPFLGYPVRMRIYRRREDLVAYHEQSLWALEKALEESRGSAR